MERRIQREKDNRQANLRRELEERSRAAEKAEQNRTAIEQGERERAAEERRKLNNDPTITAALVRIDAQEKAEQRRAAEAEQYRHEQARKDIEAERVRRERLWISDGGSPESFDTAWPEMRRKILLERQDRRDEQMRQASVF